MYLSFVYLIILIKVIILNLLSEYYNNMSYINLIIIILLKNLLI